MISALAEALVRAKLGYPNPTSVSYNPNTASATSLNQREAKNRFIDRTRQHRIDFPMLYYFLLKPSAKIAKRDAGGKPACQPRSKPPNHKPLTA